MLALPMVLALTALMALMSMLWRILEFFLFESGIFLVESLKQLWRSAGS